MFSDGQNPKIPLTKDFLPVTSLGVKRNFPKWKQTGKKKICQAFPILTKTKNKTIGYAYALPIIQHVTNDMQGEQFLYMLFIVYISV